jgi:CDP-glucose 4,6-dehydratase
MSVLLATLGHEVHGLSHEVIEKNHFELADVKRYLKSDSRIDIRNYSSIKKHLSSVEPDIVIHLAAQALVREGYRRPFETFDTNINGTINVIKSCEKAEIPNILVITSDKVYKESQTNTLFSEEDPIGGSDPYSASKAAADIVAQSLAHNAKSTLISIARAGNVIGGGDFGQERLIPDLYRAQITNIPALIRNPNAIRPWQHVLDCLDGYINILNHMISRKASGTWNVGPNDKTTFTVREICEKTAVYFRNPKIFQLTDENEFSMRESPYLRINSTKIKNDLGWTPKLSTNMAVEWTLEWYLGLLRGRTATELTKYQITKYLGL